MRALRFSAAATQDYESACDWYESRQVGLAARFTAVVDAAAQLVRRRPEAFRAVSTLHRRYVIRDFHFSLLYRFDDKQVVIEAVFHHKLSPEKLRRRLGGA